MKQISIFRLIILSIILQTSFYLKAVLIFGPNGYDHLINEFKNNIRANNYSNALNLLNRIEEFAKVDVNNNILLRAYLSANGLYDKNQINQQDIAQVQTSLSERFNGVKRNITEKIGVPIFRQGDQPGYEDTLKEIKSLVERLQGFEESGGQLSEIQQLKVEINRRLDFLISHAENDLNSKFEGKGTLLRTLLAAYKLFPIDRISEENPELAKKLLLDKIGEFKNAILYSAVVQPTRVEEADETIIAKVHRIGDILHSIRNSFIAENLKQALERGIQQIMQRQPTESVPEYNNKLDQAIENLEAYVNNFNVVNDLLRNNLVRLGFDLEENPNLPSRLSSIRDEIERKFIEKYKRNPESLEAYQFLKYILLLNDTINLMNEESLENFIENLNNENVGREPHRALPEGDIRSIFIQRLEELESQIESLTEQLKREEVAVETPVEDEYFKYLDELTKMINQIRPKQMGAYRSEYASILNAIEQRLQQARVTRPSQEELQSYSDAISLLNNILVRNVVKRNMTGIEDNIQKIKRELEIRE